METLNLGAGNRIIPGAVNVDRTKHRAEIDVVWDLNQVPWPWEDASFDKVAAIAVLEHLDIDLLTALNECHRVLRPGGQLVVKLPYWNSEASHDDPTHRWYVGLRVFDQVCPETERGKAYSFYTPHKWRYVKRPRLNRGRSSVWATLEAL
jgi:ubiquinone/menaquinone biosynthesis C-methylase UbiE